MTDFEDPYFESDNETGYYRGNDDDLDTMENAIEFYQNHYPHRNSGKTVFPIFLGYHKNKKLNNLINDRIWKKIALMKYEMEHKKYYKHNKYLLEYPEFCSKKLNDHFDSVEKLPKLEIRKREDVINWLRENMSLEEMAYCGI